MQHRNPIRKRLIPLVAIILLTSSAPATMACNDPTGADGCCRVCREGKPCGDSCIAVDKECTKGSGCACATGSALLPSR